MTSQPNEIPIKTPAEAPEEWMTADQGAFLSIGALGIVTDWLEMLKDGQPRVHQRKYAENLKERHYALLSMFLTHEGPKGPSPQVIKLAKDVLGFTPEMAKVIAKDWKVSK